MSNVPTLFDVLTLKAVDNLLCTYVFFVLYLGSYEAAPPGYVRVCISRSVIRYITIVLNTALYISFAYCKWVKV